MEPQVDDVNVRLHLSQRQADLLRRIAQVRQVADEQIALTEAMVRAIRHFPAPEADC